MICQRVALILTTLLLCIVNPAHADDLDVTVDCAIKAYAGTQPGAGSWAQILVRELKEDTTSAQIRMDGIKFWLISNQRQDGDTNREERIGTLANAFAWCATPRASTTIKTGDLIAKSEALLTAMYPPPPQIDHVIIPPSAETVRRSQAMDREAGIE
jgi:hypothetical protein